MTIAIGIATTIALLLLVSWQIHTIRRNRREHEQRMESLRTGKALKRHLISHRFMKGNKAA